MPVIKLMPDYECDPLWLVGENSGNIDVDMVPISALLQAQLIAWAKTYDAILNWDDPLSSGFASPADELAFEQEGIRLYEALQAELGTDYEVLYFSQKQSRLVAEDEISLL